MASLAVVFAAFGAAAADPELIRTEDIEYACEQRVTQRLECRYRPLFTGVLRAVTARIEQISLGTARAFSYPGAANSTAILLLVDLTSNKSPGKLEHLRSMLAHAEAHHRIGFGTFDSIPRLMLGPSASRAEIAAAIDGLVGSPAAVEPGYRDLGEAVRVLAGHRATRKAIYFFTEGQAAADGYFHPGLQRLAEEAQVVIYPLVYSPAGAAGAGLEALARLAKETRGAVIRIDPGAPSLPKELAARPFAAIDAGGRFSLDLGPAVHAGTFGARWVTVDLEFEGRRLEVPVPVTIGEATTRTTSIGTVLTAVDRDPGLGGEISVYLAAAALIAALAAGFVYYRRSRAERLAAEPDTLGVPRAYLIREGDGGPRVWLARSTWRVGRDPDNDLVVPEHSVSRHHAEILRQKDGGFVIRDLDSLNGLFVNNHKVRHAPISDGAHIDFGDVRFTFAVELPADLADSTRPK